MAYMDYSPVVLPDYSEGMRVAGDALTDLMKRREQRRQFEETQKFQREQEERKFRQAEMNNAYQNRIIDQRETRDQRDFSMRQDDRNAARGERARKAASPQEAEAILNETRSYDPATGKEIGRGKLTPGPLQGVGPEPQAPQQPEVPPEIAAAIPDLLKPIPGMPPEIAARLRAKRGLKPDAGAMVGPIPSADEARNAEEERLTFAADENTDVPARLAAVEQERQGQEAQRGDYEKKLETTERFQRDFKAFNEDSRAFPGKQAAHAAATKKAEASRPYTMSFGPNDPGTTFDFETQRFAANKEAAARFLDTVSGMHLSPDQMESAKAAHGAILAGQDPQKVFKQFQDERVLGIKQDFTGDLQTQKDAAALERTKLMANRPRASIQVGQENVNMRKFEQFQKDAERFAKRYGVTADINGLKQLDDGVRGIGGDNAALQRGVAFQLARSMQGVGPLTQQDIERVATDIAGKGGTLESWVQKASTGHLGDSEKAVLFDAVSKRLAGLKTRMQGARAEADKHFLRDKSPYRQWVGDDFIQSELDAMFPGTTGTEFQEPTGGPPEVGARRRGKKAAKAASSKDDEAMR